MSAIEISGGGFMVPGETASEVEQGVERLREPISFYGPTRTYHGVFRTHGRESLGMQLHDTNPD